MKSKHFTVEQETFIRENAKGITTAELTKKLNCHFKTSFMATQVGNYKYRRGILSGYSNLQAMIEGGKKHRFKPGRIPGPECFQKGNHYSLATEFKKGMKPKNTLPVGSEMIKSDGYIWVKVREEGLPGRAWRKWEQKHRLLWEQANGTIPKGKKLLFKDGNPLNVTLDNLILIDNRVIGPINSKKLITQFPEITETNVAIVKLLIKANDRRKETQNEK